MRISYLFFCVLFFTTACSSTPPVKKKVASQTVIKEDFTKILDANFRGILSLDLEKNQSSFKECGTNQTFQIQAKPVLQDIYQQITNAKSEPVYIEFTGEIVFSNKKDKQHNVLMRIDRIHYMARSKSSLQCAKEVSSFRFKAKGDEPYWRLNINDQKLFFATKARNQVYQIIDSNFQTTQVNNVKSVNKQEQRLNLTIEPGQCFSLNNHEYWGYIADIESVWGNLQGCGELGWPILKQNISGYYLNKTPLKTTNLTLKKNNTVEYKEKTTKSSTLKTGFWKSNSPDRVIIMLTQQKDKNIREELIFTRKGLTLTTEKINKSNIMTPLKAPGLTFKKMNTNKEEQPVKRINRDFSAKLIQPSEKVDLAVQKAIHQYFTINRTDPKNTLFNSITYDLNNDGIKDALVFLNWCSKGNCEMLIFEGDKQGYHFSSRISRISAPITIARNQHYLWQSLLIEKNTQKFKLDFDGISYPPLTNNLKLVDEKTDATDVILFSQGIPKTWFPIKE